MKKGMVFLTTVVLAATLAMPVWGAQQQQAPARKHQTPQQQPVQQQQQPKAQQQKPKPQLLPDLVISSVIKLGGVESTNLSAGQLGVEFKIVNNGTGAAGVAGSAFSVGVSYVPQIVRDCTPPPCPGGALESACSQIQQLYAVGCLYACGSPGQTYSFSFSPPIIVSTPIAVGESRTIIGRLLVPACLQHSANGKTAMVSLKVDDANQVNERNEDNNRSAPISVTW